MKTFVATEKEIEEMKENLRNHEDKEWAAAQYDYYFSEYGMFVDTPEGASRQEIADKQNALSNKVRETLDMPPLSDEERTKGAIEVLREFAEARPNIPKEEIEKIEEALNKQETE